MADPIKRSSRAQSRTRCNVKVSVWDLGDVELLEPRWDNLSNRSKMRALSYIQPDHESRSSNTTCVDLHEYIALNLDDSRSVDDKAVEVALGDGDTSPVEGNTELNNELGRTSIDEYDPDGSKLTVNAFLSKSQLNEDDTGDNPDLVELAVKTRDDRQLNHSLFSSFEKTPQRGAQLEIALDSEPKP